METVMNASWQARAAAAPAQRPAGGWHSSRSPGRAVRAARQSAPAALHAGSSQPSHSAPLLKTQRQRSLGMLHCWVGRLPCASSHPACLHWQTQLRHISYICERAAGGEGQLWYISCRVKPVPARICAKGRCLRVEPILHRFKVAQTRSCSRYAPGTI